MLGLSQNNVQSKIRCVFVTAIIQEVSSKRPGQGFNVSATEQCSDEAILSKISTASPSEKVDGTCCFMSTYNGKLCLWARLDRKLTKLANKRFKDYCSQQKQHIKHEKTTPEPKFYFTYPDDLKVVPDSWIPAHGVDRNPETGCITPDANGHVPGWVPITFNKKQYCWHHTVVFKDLVLVLKESAVDSKSQCSSTCLRLCVEPMSSYEGRTMELIGTNVNGNPYGIGTKQHPFHVLVAHGSISTIGLPADVQYDQMKDWFLNKDTERCDGNVEGVVWRCLNGNMFKLHRHHMGLPWPLCRSKLETTGCGEPSLPMLSRRNVIVSSKFLQGFSDGELAENLLFGFLKKSDSKLYNSLQELSLELS